jgi:cyclophilin family peptidyl-prolyl cis-trans isomerase
MKIKIITLFLFGMLNAFSQITKNPGFPKDTINGIFAEFITSKGKIKAILDYKTSPLAVANFMTLAEGTNNYITDEKLLGKPFYNGLKFHIVIKDNTIKSGDPTGLGNGNTGYVVRQKQTEKVRYDFDQGGFLAMDNDEKNISEFSSQFFITHRDTDWYKGYKTVFGYVLSNLDVVKSIDQNDILEKVIISRVGDEAKSFDAIKILDEYMTNVKPIEDQEIELKKQKEEEKIKKEKEEREKAVAEAKRIELEKQKPAIAENLIYFNEMKAKAKTSTSGLKYVILKNGKGIKPTNGQKVKIYYAEYLTNGYLSSTNFKDVAIKYGVYDSKKEHTKGYEPFPYTIGQKEAMLPGIVEGLNKITIGGKILLFLPSKLAYGKSGSGDVGPDTDVIFEIEMIK